MIDFFRWGYFGGVVVGSVVEIESAGGMARAKVRVCKRLGWGCKRTKKQPLGGGGGGVKGRGLIYLHLAPPPKTLMFYLIC